MPKATCWQTLNTDQRQVLDPRIAYIMTNMMEGVINNGLGYTAVRLRGFTLPAAGKTGSSHDGWFAGYTSNLLCIVWVGYDDYSELRLTGAQTAAPIWTEFMKKASLLPQYIGHETLLAAYWSRGRAIGQSHESPGDSYMSGRLHGGVCGGNGAPRDLRPAEWCDGILLSIFRRWREAVASPAQASPGQGANGQEAQDPNNPDGKKKKGFFGKLAGIFKDDKSSAPPPKPTENGQTPPQ